MSIDDVLAQVVPARQTVSICLDGTIASRLDDAQQRWRDAVSYDNDHNKPSTAPAIWDEMAALKEEAETSTVDFVVEAIGSTAWRRLIAEHPPPRDDLEGWRWNIETFPPAAVALSCIDPKMSEDNAVELAERLSDGQWTKLYGAVISVNVGDDIPKFVPGTGARPTSERSLTTAAPEASRTQSSLASEDSPETAN